MILGANPRAQYLTHKNAIDEVIQRVLESGQYILGGEVAAFEKEFSSYCGSSYAVSVGNGTEAISIALQAFDIGPGDEVITVSHTAVATVAAIEAIGASPVLVDVNSNDFTIDVSQIADAITNKTRALVPVHLYGQAADMDPIIKLAAEHDLKVIEDCAQAMGASYRGKKVGTIGDAGCFSFFPTKNLGAIGDGGMVITDSDNTANRLIGLKQYGWVKNRTSEFSGRNSRLDELQAAILRIKLPTLDADNGKRREIATKYSEAFNNSKLCVPVSIADRHHVFHLYVLRLQNRDRMIEHLLTNAVRAGIHYPLPIHLQPAYLNRIKISDLSQTEKIAGEIISLPIYPELSLQDVTTVIAAIQSFDP